MASLVELSRLSLVVYSPLEATLPPGWRVLTNSSDEDETFAGYFGVAYENLLTGEIVVASRGTETDIADWRNNADAFFGRAIDQFSAAKAFAQRVISSAPAATITFTGHSLGGGLANMLAVALDRRAVGFNSIGVETSLARAGYDATRDYRSTITNISAWFDPASLVGTRIGADKRIAVSSIPFVPDIFEPILAIVAALKFSILGQFVLAAYQVSQHSMANMVKTLGGLTDVEIDGLAPALAITATGELSGSLVGEFGSLEQAIAESGELQAVLSALQFDDQIALGSADIVAEQDTSSTNPRSILGRAASDVVLGESGSDALRGGAGIDLVAGGRGADSLDGGTGDDFLVGGEGADTYLFYSGHGADRVIDNDGGGRFVRHDRPVALGIREEEGSNVWRMAGITFTRNGADLQITFDGGGDSITVEDFDFAAAEQGGSLGIRLIDEPTAPDSDEPTAPNNFVRTFHGDKKDWDSDPNQEGVQTENDLFGNVKREDGQEGRPDSAEAGRADTFNGSTSDEAEKFTTAGGDDVVFGDGESSAESSSGGRDLIETGAGRDSVRAGAGNDWVEGGEGGDLLWGNRGDDAIYAGATAGQTLTIAQAIEAGESGAQAEGPGDLLGGDEGDDVLIGAATADFLAGGAGADVVVAGAGDDTIYADASVTQASPEWTVDRTLSTLDSGVVRVRTDNLTLTVNASAGAADVVHGGAGRDWVVAGAGNDWVEGGADGDVSVTRPDIGRQLFEVIGAAK